MTQKKVRIIDNISGETLFEDSFKNMDKIYQKASEYEEMGLDTKITSPSVSQTLIMSLGASEKDVEELKQAELDEIDEHNQPTCTTKH